MRLDSTSDGATYGAGFTIYHPEAAGARYYALWFALDRIQVAGTSDNANIDTTVWHDYRMSLDPDSSTLMIFVDDSPTPLLVTNGGYFTTGSPTNGMYFGEGYSSGAGTSQWSFFGWAGGGALPGDAFLAIPEPSTLVLLALGMIGLALAGRRRKG